MNRDKVVIALPEELWDEIVALLESYDDSSDSWLMRQLGYTCCLFKHWARTIEDGQRVAFNRELFEVDNIDEALDAAIHNRQNELELLLKEKERRTKNG